MNNKSEIKPIETIYNGYRFRSRLEARWAVFFDALNITYEYEKEGFDLGEAGFYLPDFWIPMPDHEYKNAGYWVEIKPCELTDLEYEKCKQLAIKTGHTICIIVGNPWPKEFTIHKYSRNGNLLRNCGILDEYPPDDQWPHITYPCFAALCGQESNFVLCDPATAFEKAYRLARQARFEHGEKPSGELR